MPLHFKRNEKRLQANDSLFLSRKEGNMKRVDATISRECGVTDVVTRLYQFVAISDPSSTNGLTARTTHRIQSFSFLKANDKNMRARGTYSSTGVARTLVPFRVDCRLSRISIGCERGRDLWRTS